jgi:hypothetical protein
MVKKVKAPERPEDDLNDVTTLSPPVSPQEDTIDV